MFNTCFPLVLPARKRVQSENPTRSSVALRCEAVNSSGPNAASSTVATSQSTDESSESSNSSDSSSDSSDSERTAKKKKKDKNQKNRKKSKKQRIDFRWARTPEDSIKCYHKVVQLVKGGLSKAEAYHKIKVDRNTIVMQAPIAELATANPEEFKALRATFKKGESIQKFSNVLCTLSSSA
ncbi:coiled-coil domain-containing protein 106-like isoform X2 [Triplophysa rosa]|uniref:coiled-coil domain-containing protein 106-like isoform X2 n=1 Tax=Triplophysa rosa TaxID=992332 RepID=UPI002545CC31|nr:coiled-coil domain-containing protein 106-like isoform X2 [Triplophysa rosa]